MDAGHCKINQWQIRKFKGQVTNIGTRFFRMLFCVGYAERKPSDVIVSKKPALVDEQYFISYFEYRKSQKSNYTV